MLLAHQQRVDPRAALQAACAEHTRLKKAPTRTSKPPSISAQRAGACAAWGVAAQGPSASKLSVQAMKFCGHIAVPRVTTACTTHPQGRQRCRHRGHQAERPPQRCKVPHPHKPIHVLLGGSSSGNGSGGTAAPGSSIAHPLGSASGAQYASSSASVRPYSASVKRRKSSA